MQAFTLVRYRVDRLKSVRALECFLEGIEIKVDREVEWLEHIRADCVLSDSAFLGWSEFSLAVRRR